MQAIILAAGMGRRLGELTTQHTKSMVPVNGTPLIDRMLRQLASHQLKRVIIVIGYKGEELRQHIGNRFPELNIQYVENPVYETTNNIYSLALAANQLQEDDTLLIESDLIVDDSLFSLILSDPNPNLALVAKYQSWMDGTMVKIDEQQNILNFVPKKAFRYDEVDQYYKTVNIYKFSRQFSQQKYVPFINAYCKALGPNEYYEQVLQVITHLDKGNIKALPIGDEKWYEIDDVQDLDIAEAIFAEEKDILRKYYGRFGGFWRFGGMLDFCYLVNPYFPTPRLKAEIRTFFDTLLTQYPSGMKINSLIASKSFGVRQDYILPGNGAAELIKTLLDMLPGKLGVVRPTFEEYPNRFEAERLVTFFPQNEDYRYNADDLMNYFSVNRADTLLIINPDNPSGNYIPVTDLLKLAKWTAQQGMRLIVDESFVDFSEDWQTASLLHNSLLEENPNLIVMKSISKSYGVPGLRLGILASADMQLISRMKAAVPIWNINSFAEYFMQIYTKHEADYHEACGKFVEERKTFEQELKQISYLRVMPTQANYFLCEVLKPHTAREIVLTMLKRYNILTRDCSLKPGLNPDKQYMRIAVRNREENHKLYEALSSLG
ncbi:MAG: aminotransferase class I/II-fold pyridoxal phosphate-dependent enzyme [Bacteroidaceae bacterium]|nr:aminotransferase class I/II-fold pyridoxal phosphate-dependent enzyme [Bacteroidaceae bacterium]MBO4593115.1 aminotransferase class I/II-fold pyridoxal phosphate-dependent enzyme [Bacteroidaceae bacterium]